MADEQSSAPASSESSESNESQDTSQLEASQEASPEQSLEEQVKEQNPDLSKKEVKAEIKRLKQLKLKVDGKELTEDLPFDIPDDPKAVEWMKKNLQMSKMAQSRAQEKAQLEKEVLNLVEELRKNPRKVLSDPNLGVDLKELAAQIIQEEIENSKKSPEQIEKERIENELKALKEEREKEKEDFKKKEFERLQQQEYERYDRLMTQALDKSDLPKSPYVVKKMADFMLMGLEEGLDVTPEDVLPLVREEILADIKDMFAVMPEEVIESIVGKDKISSLRKKSIAKGKEQTNPLKSSVKDVGNKAKQAKDDAQKVSFKDFFKI